jgi:hypothetical protein
VRVLVTVAAHFIGSKFQSNEKQSVPLGEEWHSGTGVEGTGVQGVYGVANGSGQGVYGAAGPQGSGVVGVSSGTGTGTGVAGYGASSGSGVVGTAGSGGGYGVFSYGNMGATGTKSAVVPLPDDRVVSLYAVESPENWFEDFGSGELNNGVATIEIDPTFSQTVSLDVSYHVFLTPNGDCEGLYVAQKSATGFEVRELRAGKSNVAFDYRIVAKRKGLETLRMEEVSTDHDTAEAVRHQTAARPSHPPKLVLPKAPENGAVPEPPKTQVPLPATDKRQLIHEGGNRECEPTANRVGFYSSVQIRRALCVFSRAS